MSTPWIEKHRPKRIGEVAFQDEVVNALKKSIETKNLPHLLFYGPPGTGKTSTILAIARELYGENWRRRVLELNASDERGIRVLTPKVKNFAQLACPKDDNCPPYKIVILDEADFTTPFAQTALRRVIEIHSKSTRFCLICNYVSRIIDPLASRCAKFRFKPVSKEAMIKRLKEVSLAEGIKWSDELGLALAEQCNGDLRAAIQCLQTAYIAHGHNLLPHHLTETAGAVPDDLIDSLVDSVNSGDFDRVQSAASDCIAMGYPVDSIFSRLFDRVLLLDETLTQSKSGGVTSIIDALAVADHCLKDGADEFLQLMAVLTVWMKVVL